MHKFTPSVLCFVDSLSNFFLFSVSKKLTHYSLFFMEDTDQMKADSFSDLLGPDVVPIKKSDSLRHSKKGVITPGKLIRRESAVATKHAPNPSFDLESAITFVEPNDYLDFKKPGIQHGVYKNLRQGKYEIQSRLDLHRHTVEQARNALWQFLRDCEVHNVRCALVTHGKGEGRLQPAKLKSCVNHWLRQFNSVLAFHTAQRRDGGMGATYVLLKKSETEKLKTAEKLSKK